MTRISSRIVWLPLALVCTIAAACGGSEKGTDKPLGGSSDPVPTAKATKSEDLADRVTAHTKATIKLIEANKGDCSALGQKLTSYVSDNEAFLKKMIKSADSLEAKSWKDENEELVKQLNGSMEIVTKKCKNDSGVQEFVKAMTDLAK